MDFMKVMKKLLCKQGKVKCLTAGNKVLVDMQSLLDYIEIKPENKEA